MTTTTAKSKANDNSKPKVTKKATTSKGRTSSAASRKKAAVTQAKTDHGAVLDPTTTTDTTTNNNNKSPVRVTKTPQSLSHILIVDNGGDTIKYGWSTDTKPSILSNVTARLQQQWAVLAADQLATIQNPNQLINITRSTERGIVVNFGNQIQVWKRMLDLLGITLTSLTTDTAQAFGWKQSTRNVVTDATPTERQNNIKIPAANCAVLVTVPPHCPRMVLDQMMLIWMEDFGFSHVGFTTAQVAASANQPPSVTAQPTTNMIPATCVVDVGWSACTVVPTYRHKAIHVNAIRRLPIGGRHLINMCQYYFSYRQWNLMDQEWIARQVLEKTGYVSLEFYKDMRLARRLPAGRRPFDREFLLPDYQTSFEGQVQLPPALQKMEDEEDDEDGDEDDDDDEDDEDVREEDMNEEDVELDLNEEIEQPKEEEEVKNKVKQKSKKASPRKGRKRNEEDDNDDNDDEADDEEDDEEEDLEALRKRLIKQREEEEQRRRALEAERQSLRLSVERFTVPEVLFRPSDGGLPREWAGLAGTVVQAIDQCPEHFRAAMYRDVRLVGGLSQLPNLKERLTQELRSLAPCDYKLHVTTSESPKEEIWQGAKTIATASPHSEWSISKEEYTPRGSWRRLTHAEGGAIV